MAAQVDGMSFPAVPSIVFAPTARSEIGIEVALADTSPTLRIPPHFQEV